MLLKIEKVTCKPFIATRLKMDKILSPMELEIYLPHYLSLPTLLIKIVPILDRQQIMKCSII